MNYQVERIPAAATIEWTTKKHYARRRPCISFAFGLFDGLQMVGVCTFGNALPMTMRRGVCGENFQQHVYELNRLCLNENLPKNTASFFVARCLKLLPPKKIIVSYSDMAQNHHGYIYQAANFLYTGTAFGHTLKAIIAVMTPAMW